MAGSSPHNYGWLTSWCPSWLYIAMLYSYSVTMLLHMLLLLIVRIVSMIVAILSTPCVVIAWRLWFRVFAAAHHSNTISTTFIKVGRGTSYLSCTSTSSANDLLLSLHWSRWIEVLTSTPVVARHIQQSIVLYAWRPLTLSVTHGEMSVCVSQLHIGGINSSIIADCITRCTW